MKHLFWVFVLLGCCCVTAKAQNPVQFQPTSVSPNGQACNSTRGNLKTPDGTLYTCQNGHMAAVGGGGGGTCTSLGGDVTGTCAANTVVKIHNGSVPASAVVVGTNSSSQPVAAATTGSGTTVPLSVSPAFTGTPTTPTGAVGDASTQIANDAALALALQAINPATNVQVSTTTILPNTPTYNNQSGGVGATLTAGSNTTLAAIDGYTVLLNDRILVQNQVTTANNGCYTLTATGSGSAPWVLTRCVDYNTPTNINYTGSICTIQVGSMYAADTCFSITNLITTVGTSPITYTQQTAGSNAGKPGGGVQIIGNVTVGDALKVAAGNSGKNIQDAGIAFSKLTQTIASGTKALATGAITSGTCTSAQTATATGTLTTDDIMADFNADPTGVTGYAPSSNGMLTIIKYPTTDTVNFKVCNNTSASITPGAITLNFRVTR